MREVNGLRSELLETVRLSTVEINGMFRLMEQYFDGMDKEKFETDLLGKRWAIVLRETADDTIRGFSTITLMETSVAGKRVKAFYSGDTIVDRSCWRPFSLEKEWTPLVFSHVFADPAAKWYWFMVCKGYRTYRYFSVHFHKFWPSPDEPTPFFAKEVLDTLATLRFGRHYDPQSGIITCPADYRLKPGVGDISPEKSKNRYVHYFEAANPDWANGAELACLTPLKLDNLRPAVRRFLPGQSPEPA